MSPETDLRARLDHELDHLPSRPGTDYLARGRRTRQRRRALTAAAASVAVAATVISLQLVSPGADDRSDSLTDQPTATAVAPDLSSDTDFVAPRPNNPVEAVDWASVEGSIDWFTTDEIPRWAQEQGNHGPVSVSPDGRLWVAPDATIRRIVVDPYTPGEHGIVASWAVEASCPCLPEDMTDDIGWVLMSSTGSGSGEGGRMDAPVWNGYDFELWVDGATAEVQGRPTIAERFAHFAGRRSGRMVAGSPDVTLVRQEADADLGQGGVRHTRAGAAEVEYDGKTFYVVGVDPEEGAPWYRWFAGDTQPDFDAFLTMLRGTW